MGARVIQGFFVGGGRPEAAAAPIPRGTVQRVVAPAARPGPPPAAFLRGTMPVQQRPAPGRPPLVDVPEGGQVAQRFGGDGSVAIDPAQVGLASSGGIPLPKAVLAKMEAAFGADFSGVRVHVGPQASRIGALAFATGNDLYFAPGQFDPASVRGQQLIGHELAHVVQQRQGRVRARGNGIAIVHDRILEAEADRLGAQIGTLPDFAAPAGRLPSTPIQRRSIPQTRQGRARSGVVQPMKRAFEGSASSATQDDRRVVPRTGPAVSIASLPDDAINLIMGNLSLAEVADAMLVNKRFRDRILALLARATGAFGLDPSIYRGIAIAVNRHAPNDQWLKHAAPVGVGVLPGDKEDAQDVARALVWRGYGGVRPNRTHKAVTLERIGRQLLRHLAITIPMRNYIRGNQASVVYPNGPYDVGAHALDHIVQDVGHHWRDTLGMQATAVRDEDRLARILATTFGLRSNGQNISVAFCGTARRHGVILAHHYSVFSNYAVQDDVKTTIQNASGLAAVLNRQSWSQDFRPLLDEIIAGRIRFHLITPTVGVPKYGHRRSSTRWNTFDIPFHSEAQRFDTTPPWAVGNRYAGNDYCACPQCAAVYRSIGRTDLYAGGSHLRKSPSVIPTQVRENSVYLKEYLGPAAYKKFKALTVQQQFVFLDHLERIKESRIDAIEPNMNGPAKRSFLW